MNDFEFDNKMDKLNEELAPYIKTEPIFPTKEIIKEDEEEIEDMHVESEEIIDNIIQPLDSNTYNSELEGGEVLSSFESLDDDLLQYFSNARGRTLATFLASLNTTNTTNTKTTSKKKICSSYNQ